ncbi:unnamed protein product [Adineta ricciae]|uniref:Uncharacterized protein n=1 Tax=Adineta ricciae TaxID=249248 RepID=A0A813V2V0_ADIRI|nr:unnamed protein product [Adineta ricciae]CAF1414822.1 unnamed protein product [Adineta ricciae]
MASMINHLQKALRHHAPVIRFRYGANHTDPHSSSHHESENVSASPTSTNNNQFKSSGISTTLEFSQTPQKYRRQPLTQDEIDLVNIGGFT